MFDDQSRPVDVHRYQGLEGKNSKDVTNTMVCERGCVCLWITLKTGITTDGDQFAIAYTISTLFTTPGDQSNKPYCYCLN